EKYILIILIGFSFPLYAQNQHITDSLENLITTLDDSAKIYNMHKLAREYRKTNPEKTIEYIHRTINLVKKAGNLPWLKKIIYNNAIKLHYQMGNTDSALIYSHHYYDMMITAEDSVEMSQSANNIGVLYKIKGDYANALEYYKQSLDIKEKSGNQLGIAKSFNNIGLVYEQLGSFEKALDFYLQSLDKKRKIGNKKTIAITLINIGNTYEKLNMDNMAMKSQHEALANFKDIDYNKGIATAFNNIGKLLQGKGHVADAYNYYQKALVLNDSIKNISGIAYTYNNLGEALSDMEKYDEAIAMFLGAIEKMEDIGNKYALANFNLNIANTYFEIGNFQLAEYYLDNSFAIARVENLRDLESQILLSYAELRAQQGRYNEALMYNREGHTLRDSIFNEESKQAIANLQIVNEIEKKQEQIDKLTEIKNVQAEKLNQAKHLTWSLIINLIAFLIIIIFGIIRFRQISKFNKLLNKQKSELSKQNEFLNTLIKTIPGPMFYKDKNKRILGCNADFENMVGIKEKELIGKTLEEYKSYDSIDDHSTMDDKTLKERGINKYESTIVYSDKKRHDVLIYKSRYSNENNEVAGLLGVVIDISDRKRNEKKIKQNEKRLEILNQLNKNLFNSYESLLKQAHQTFCKFSLAKRSFCLSWLPGTDQLSEHSCFNPEIDRVYLNRQITFEFSDFPVLSEIRKKRNTTYLSKDEIIDNRLDKLFKSSFHIKNIALIPIIEGDMVVGVAGIANFDKDNIADKVLFFSQFSSEIWGLLQRNRSFEDLQKREQDLAESNAAKNKFFSIIGHDLKNPFNAILGFAQLLSEYFDDFKDEEKLQYINNLREAAETTYKLLQNLLQWSFTQTGQLECKPEEIDLSIYANECAVYSKPEANRKNIRISIDIGYNSIVVADPNMVKTVFRNLVSNAIKFSERGQSIKITITKDDKFRTVHIADNGVGIEPENIEKLFKVGEKIKTPGTEQENGSGLGLILCHEFIEKNRGRIWAESKYGNGSTFSFSLPIAP
ncbi:MAG: tetratricopeptide repeat protein, partial [Bacteroidota bacterium]|nr:tetratricopeptide repeat protein [Bacteroidota bacterium]